MNSEEFRETFLRNDREGPTKAKDGGKEGSQAVAEKRSVEERRVNP